MVKTSKSEWAHGASVTAKNHSTGFTASTLAGKDGKYTFLQLPLGSTKYIPRRTTPFVKAGLWEK